MKNNIKVFLSENFQFLVVKFSIYLKGVFSLWLNQLLSDLKKYSSIVLKKCFPRSSDNFRLIITLDNMSIYSDITVFTLHIGTPNPYKFCLRF